MIRCSIWMPACVCCAAMAAIAPLRAEQKLNAGPTCLYESKSYSDGAYICVQKSLMLNCSSDGTKATWRIVADRDLNERCTVPMALNHPLEPRTRVHRRHAIRYKPLPVAESAARCFMFNSRQYCE
jgi:hypothetical protein